MVRILAGVLAALAVLLAPPLQAQSGTWSVDADGNWGTAANWAGGTIASGADATASFTVNITAARTVTLDAPFTVGSVVFTDLVTSSHDLTISGANTLTLDTTTGVPVVNVTQAGRTLTIGSVIAGSDGLRKIGVGALVLNGSTANTFTGGLQVNGGVLTLNYANMTTLTDLVNANNELRFGGGALALTASTGGANLTTQNFSGLTLLGGGSLLANPNGGLSTAINVGALTTTASGGSLLVGRAVGAGTGSLDITTPTNVDTTGIYGGRVVFGTGTASTGYDWATTASGGSPYTLSAYSAYSAMTLAGTDTLNSRITAGAVLTGAVTTNTLKFENPATAQTLDLGGQALTLTAGGLLFTGASVAQGPRISNGTLTAGNSSGSYDLVVHNYHANNVNGPGNLTVTNNVDIIAAITDNGTNPVRLVIAGTSAVRISNAANTFTGGIVLNGGSLISGTATSLNNNSITVNLSTTLFSTGATTTTGGITINNSSQLFLVNNNSTFTVGGPVTGSGGISIDRGGLGSMTVSLNSTANTFTGPIQYPHRQANQTANLTVNSLADTSIIGDGNITFGFTPFNAGSTNGTSNSQNFTVGTGAIAPLTLSNRQFELATIQPIQTINNNSSQPLTINTNLLVTGNTGKALTLGGTGTGLNTFAGNIGNVPSPTAGSTILALQKGASATTLTLASVQGIQVGDAISGTNITANTTVSAINALTRVVTISPASAAATQNAGIVITTPNVINSVQITKAGSGTWVLGGTNTYIGGTVLSAGVLQFGRLVSMPATGVVSAATGTTLAVNLGGTGEWTTATSGNGTIGGLLAGLGGQTGGTITYTTTATLGFDTTNASPTTQTYAGVIPNVATTLGITKLGANTLELSATNTYTGLTGVAAGSLTLSGGFTSAARNIYSGTSVTGSAATLNITAGSYPILTGEIRVNHPVTAGPAAVNTINQTGGAVSLTTGTVQILIGSGSVANTGTGIYNLSGGSLTIQASATAGRGIILGATNTTTATFNLSGTGMLNMTTASGGLGDANLSIGRFDVVSFGDSVTALFNQTGGTASIGNLHLGGNAANGINGTQTLTLTAGTFAANVFTRLSQGNGNVGTVNIGGTADITLPAFPTARGTGATATLNFDGGLLRPAAASTAYISGLDNAFVRAGGARFNTGGFDIAIPQNLLTHAVSTGGGLNKAGAGALTLTGANTYTGGSVITAGVLAADTASPNSATGTSAVTVNAGTLRGVGNIAGTITLNGGTIAPGDATNAGVLTTVGNPVLLTGGMTFNLAGGLANSSQLNITGPGTLNLGTALTLAVAAFTGASDPASFTLIASTGTSVAGTFSGFAEGTTVFTNSGTGTAYGIFYGTFPGQSGNVVLAPGAIPEPAALLAVLAAFALVRRRR